MESEHKLTLMTAELQHVVNAVETRLDGHRRLAHVIDDSASRIEVLEALLSKLKGAL